MNIKVQSKWRNYLTHVAHYKVGTREVALTKEIAAGLLALLGSAAIISGAYGRITSSVYFTFAAIVAAVSWLVIYIRHTWQKKQQIVWPVILPLLLLQCTAVGVAIAYLDEGVVERHIPTVLTLWASDFPHFNELSHVDYPNDADHQARYFFKLVQDLDSKSKFLTVYIPDTPLIGAICEQIADNLQNFLRPRYSVQGQAGGEAYPSDNLHLTFTGAVLIYYEGALSPEEIAKIHRAFERAGASIQLRGSDYSDLVGAGILRGVRHQPPDYKIQDGLPCMIAPQKPPIKVQLGIRFLIPQGEGYNDIPVPGVRTCGR